MTSPADTTPTPPRGLPETPTPSSSPGVAPPTDPSGAPQEVVVTRSEEQLRVGTETVVVGRARLRKVVVTEERTVTVALRHEEYVLDHEPITDGAPLESTEDPFPPLGTPDGAGVDAVEVVLHAERPVITTEIVPVERIRLSTRTVTTDHPVTGPLRHEVVEYHAPEARPPAPPSP